MPEPAEIQKRIDVLLLRYLDKDNVVTIAEEKELGDLFFAIGYKPWTDIPHKCPVCRGVLYLNTGRRKAISAMANNGCGNVFGER